METPKERRARISAAKIAAGRADTERRKGRPTAEQSAARRRELVAPDAPAPSPPTTTTPYVEALKQQAALLADSGAPLAHYAAQHARRVERRRARAREIPFNSR